MLGYQMVLGHHIPFPKAPVTWVGQRENENMVPTGSPSWSLQKMVVGLQICIQLEASLSDHSYEANQPLTHLQALCFSLLDPGGGSHL